MNLPNTITAADLVQTDEPTLNRHRHALAGLPGDADATITSADGRRLTIIDEDTLEVVWAARALALLGAPSAADSAGTDEPGGEG